MSDCGKSEEENFTQSTDSTSTFEFIEGRLLSNNSREGTTAWSSQPLSTKEEKQKHNEEIVMESAGSWEKIEINDEIESCREFLVNEKSFHDIEISCRPSVSSKPCFIDASSLLDDDYMPISFAAALRESPKGTAGYSGPSSFSQPDIKDQFSAIPSHFHIPKSHQQHLSLNDVTTTADHEKWVIKPD
mgnify:CR=1 FL=1